MSGPRCPFSIGSMVGALGGVRVAVPFYLLSHTVGDLVSETTVGPRKCQLVVGKSIRFVLAVTPGPRRAPQRMADDGKDKVHSLKRRDMRHAAVLTGLTR